GRDRDIFAGDAHGGGALEHVDRFLLARVRVHDRRLARLVAGDLRPELIGLEEHLAYALVGSEVLQGVQVEHLVLHAGDSVPRFAPRARLLARSTRGEARHGHRALPRIPLRRRGEERRVADRRAALRPATHSDAGEPSRYEDTT